MDAKDESGETDSVPGTDDDRSRYHGVRSDAALRPNIVIVIPVFNEAAALPQLVEQFAAVEWGSASVRIILVDDGSTDGTSTVSWQRAGCPPVETVVHHTNRGLGRALDSGLMRALGLCTDDATIVTMDGDNTHLPGDIPTLVAACASGWDVAIGSRYQPCAVVRGVPWWRRLLSRGASWLFRLRYRLAGVRDYTSGFRAYRASVLARAHSEGSSRLVDADGFECQLQLLLKLASQGAKFHEAPIQLRYDRKQGRSKNRVVRTIVKSLRLLRRGVK